MRRKRVLLTWWLGHFLQIPPAGKTQTASAAASEVDYGEDQGNPIRVRDTKENDLSIQPFPPGALPSGMDIA